MKAFVLTHVGLEDVSADEIKSLISSSNISISPGRVFFSCNSEQDLVDLCYRGRTFNKVVLLLSEFSVEGLPDFSIFKDAESFIGKSCVVRCDRFGNHVFTSFDVEKHLNGFLSSKYSVDFKHPSTIFFVLIDNKKGFFGIDFSGVDLGKRDYRIFLGPDSLKGSLAAGLLLISGFNSKMSLLDPFCHHGIVPIEAALLSTKTSPNKFGKEKFGFCNLPNRNFVLTDKECDFKGVVIAMDENFKNVSSSKKNAKIAGVIKSVEFSRTDLKWLDAKFGKNFIDSIVSYPVQLGRLVSDSFFDKVYHELFYQAEFILKKSGKICLLMKRGVDVVKKNAEEFKFSLVHERKVMQGEVEFSVLVFSKQ